MGRPGIGRLTSGVGILHLLATVHLIARVTDDILAAGGGLAYPHVPRELRGLPQDERNRDYGLERLVILEERKQLHGRGGWGINRGF